MDFIRYLSGLVDGIYNSRKTRDLLAFSLVAALPFASIKGYKAYTGYIERREKEKAAIVKGFEDFSEAEKALRADYSGKIGALEAELGELRTKLEKIGDLEKVQWPKAEAGPLPIPKKKKLSPEEKKEAAERRQVKAIRLANYIKSTATIVNHKGLIEIYFEGYGDERRSFNMIEFNLPLKTHLGNCNAYYLEFNTGNIFADDIRKMLVLGVNSRDPNKQCSLADSLASDTIRVNNRDASDPRNGNIRVFLAAKRNFEYVIGEPAKYRIFGDAQVAFHREAEWLFPNEDEMNQKYEELLDIFTIVASTAEPSSETPNQPANPK